MVKLEPTRQKIPGKKVLIYLLLILSLILVLVVWDRISLIFQTFFQFSN
jgi:hypothetical protein